GAHTSDPAAAAGDSLRRSSWAGVPAQLQHGTPRHQARQHPARRKHAAQDCSLGLLRVGEGTTVQATRVMGTPGYVDPAYARTQKATTATDVYSFGLLMLMVTTGRDVTFFDEGKSVNVADWVKEQIGRNDIAALKDPRMEAPEDIIMRIMQLAVRCTAKRTANRPSMTDIAIELQAILIALGGPTSKVFRAAEQVDAQLDSVSSNPLDLDEAFSMIDGMKEQEQQEMQTSNSV
ncbi:unnamed protein product, partial [Closterium sp. Yama58-4]